MPVHSGRDKKGCYEQWGSSGKKYYYRCGNKSERESAKKKATAQGRAVHSSGYEALAVTRVSYGYSGCITNHEQQEQAMDYIKKGVEVFILSSRDEPEGMLLIADHLGLSHDNIFATGDNDVKIQKIIDLQTDIHYDTNPYILENIGDIAEEVTPAEMKNIKVVIEEI